MIPGNAAEKILINTYNNLTIAGSQPKYFAIPPQTPPIILSFDTRFNT